MIRIGMALIIGFFISFSNAAPQFRSASPDFHASFYLKGAKLCATAKQTLAYLNKGVGYDPQVIHDGRVISISLTRVKDTLRFICQNQSQLNDPQFIKKHFDFIRWYPDLKKAHSLSANKPLLRNMPNDRILMTKYYVHMAHASPIKQSNRPYALYGLPFDEHQLTLEEANAKPHLIRFKYGKQAILKGALIDKSVPSLAYVTRDDLEAALLQGTVVVNFSSPMGKQILNVHRTNNIAYDRTKSPYEQERYWYFKRVDGIKGYGKDAEHKITIDPEVTFAADLEQFGLGKLLMIQYPDKSGKIITSAGIFADTGGAFANNLYQVDYLAGSYSSTAAFSQANHHLPDYVDAYFMMLKDKK